MAYIQTRQVDAGELISGTFRELLSIKRELAMYFGLFLALGLIADFLSVLQGPISLLATILYFVGQYLLYRELLSRSGIAYDEAMKVFSFFFMALVLGVPIMFGLNFFVIPGILLAAKWIMAPTFLVAEEVNLFESIGASWRASEDNLLPISLAFTALFLIWTGLYFLFGAVGGGLGYAIQGSGFGGFGGIGWVLVHALPVMLMGLSVAAYRALSDTENSLVAVFE